MHVFEELDAQNSWALKVKGTRLLEPKTKTQKQLKIIDLSSKSNKENSNLLDQYLSLAAERKTPATCVLSYSSFFSQLDILVYFVTRHPT